MIEKFRKPKKADIDKAIAAAAQIAAQVRNTIRDDSISKEIEYTAMRAAFSQLVPESSRKQIHAVMYANEDLATELIRVRAHLSPEWKFAVDVLRRVQELSTITQVMEE